MNNNAKLKYIFVAGVEGCGHHGLNPVIANALKNSQEIRRTNGVVITNKRRLKRIFNWYWCKSHPIPFTKIMVTAMINRFFRVERRKTRKNNHVRIIIEDNSFPAGTNRDLNKQWDIIEMMELVRPYADEIYFIGLYRDPIAATFSHKGFDGGLLQHARVVKKSQTYINDQLSRLGTAKKLFIRYEDLIDRQKKVGPVIAEFLGIDDKDVETGFSEIRPSKKDWRRDMSPQDQEKMLAIFSDEEAKKHWPLYANAQSYSD